MRQLSCIEARTLAWHDLPVPSLPSDMGALVRPLVVSTCDKDGAVISGLVRFRGPVPVGHEGVGEVVEIGDAVATLRPGDRVIMPWKISCGECSKCRAGLTAHCQSVPHEAAYGWGPTAREWGGFLADFVAVPSDARRPLGSRRPSPHG
jgi:alcohol dehydrogenase